jgi:hypothetical protein
MTRSLAFFKSANLSRSIFAAASASLLIFAASSSKRSLTLDKLNPALPGERVVTSFFILGGGRRFVFGVESLDCDMSGFLNFVSADTPNAGVPGGLAGFFCCASLSLSFAFAGDPNGEKLFFDTNGETPVFEEGPLNDADPNEEVPVSNGASLSVERNFASEETPNGELEDFWMVLLASCLSSDFGASGGMPYGDCPPFVPGMLALGDTPNDERPARDCFSMDVYLGFGSEGGFLPNGENVFFCSFEESSSR